MSSDAGMDRQRGLSEEATRWLVLLQSGDLGAEQRAEFVDWLRESPTHISELLRVAELESELATLSVWRTIEPLSTNQGNVVALEARVGMAAPGSRATGAAPAYRRIAVAACVALALAAGFVAVNQHGDLQLRTMPGEHRELALEDGSILDLAPDTDLAVHYDLSHRSIVLERGQATFHVAKNPQRPFIVDAAGTKVRAVGTVFNVARGDTGVHVSVVEGHVAVTPQRPLAAALRSEPRPPVVNLNPDEEIVVNASGQASPVRLVRHSAQEPAPRATLSFENETVADVAEKFNARNDLFIDVRSPDVARRRISGVFYANDPDSFIAFVAAVTDAEIQREASNRVMIGAR